MKKLRFKSLTMRIWITFTIIILIIICSITFIYLFAFRAINETARVNDLKVSHDILLKSKKFDQPNRFDELGNLKGSRYFIYKKDKNGKSQIISMDKPKDVPPPPLKSSGASKSSKTAVLLKPSHGDFQVPRQFEGEVQKWMAAHIKTENIYEEQFKGTYKNVRFLFIISAVNYDKFGKAYLISYMPDFNDNSFLIIAIFIGFIFISIGFITAKLVAYNISKPLKELEEYTVRIAHKDWKDPIVVKSDDEIGKLADSMNRMQKELKRAAEEEKTFLQSISHDLKTPVMVIMSHAEAIIDGVYIDSAEKTAEIIRDEAISLDKKIKQMLYLNTLDYSLENNSQSTEINLRELLFHIINRFEIVNSKIEWSLEINDIIFKCNKDKLQVAIENILENGLRYAKGKICVFLNRKDDFIELEIYNDGPNIDVEHINHIFDNLYKDETGNFGLGLAITKKIINFYKGEIYVTNRNVGVSFMIKLPYGDRK